MCIGICYCWTASIVGCPPRQRAARRRARHSRRGDNFSRADGSWVAMVSGLSRRARDGVVAELAQTSQLLKTIIDSSPFATMAFDAEQRVVVWSAGAERLFGWTADEVVGGPIPK